MTAKEQWDGNLDSVWVADEVFNLRPDYVAVLVTAYGLVGGPSDSQSEELINRAETVAKETLTSCEPHELPHLAEWRNTYAAFGVKPREGRSSVEALMRRISSGLPKINNLTDTYNAISVLYNIPVGGETLEAYVGPPRLVVAVGDEEFDTVADGAPVIGQAAPGEVIWRDDIGVTCRRWNWRQCVRTRIDEHTTDALFIFDALGADAEDRATRAADALVRAFKSFSPRATFAQRTITCSKS